MPGPEYPDAPPPQVPEEFAAAYREAYQHALGSGPDAAGPPEVLAGRREARWFVPVLLGAGALVLVIGAYAVGAALSHNDSGATETSAATGAERTTGPSRSSAPGKPTAAAPSRSPGGWTGPVSPVSVDAIAADCTAPPSRDSAGHEVSYAPGNAVDGRIQTAWRCVGTAVGQKLTLRLAGDTDIAQVGLVPGYAKTDPQSGVDRYAENNRIIRVRWTLGDGESVVQRLDGRPSSPAMQVVRVPRTTTDTVTLEILAVKRGARNTTAISEISLAAAS